jgi:hypothetical protein
MQARDHAERDIAIPAHAGLEDAGELRAVARQKRPGQRDERGHGQHRAGEDLTQHESVSAGKGAFHDAHEHQRREQHEIGEPFEGGPAIRLSAA